MLDIVVKGDQGIQGGKQIWENADLGERRRAAVTV